MFSILRKKIPTIPELKLIDSKHLSIAYHRPLQTLMDHTQPIKLPVIMPPFADKALLISCLNSWLSNVASVDLQLQYDEMNWVMSNNQGPNLKRLIDARRNYQFEAAFYATEVPLTASQQAFFNEKTTIATLIDKLLTSCSISYEAMFNFYTDGLGVGLGLRQLNFITSYQFIGTMEENSFLTAWLFIANQIDAEFVMTKLKFLGSQIAMHKIENIGNLMTTALYVIKIININLDSNLELLRA